MTLAPLLAPARRTYRGTLTTPDRWATWEPRPGDILVCTPAKCGTTWTQTMLTMLLHGTTDLPDTVGNLSPWVDSDLGDAEAVRARLEAQPGRRVVKTHTPADGFPVWEGVTVIAVFRHPLDVFLSLRNHAINMRGADTHPMRGPIATALDGWLDAPANPHDIDRDTLGSIVLHLERALSAARPDVTVFHYAAMHADHRGALRRLADAAGIAAPDTLVDAIARATALDAMRRDAARFAPEGGTGFWDDDRAFFATGGTGNWTAILSDGDVARYRTRLAHMLPDPTLRRWLESGGALTTPVASEAFGGGYFAC